jgi:hypothetical protein
MLNFAVFGITAKQRRETNPEQAAKGNIRDFANLEQLTGLSNMESLNAELTRRGASQEARLRALCDAAAFHLRIFSHDRRLKE